MKQKPEPLMRILAYIIDALVLIPVLIVVGIVIFILSLILGSTGIYLGMLLLYASIIAYTLGRDALPIEALNGASVGKKLLGFRAETTFGQKLTIEQSARRNAPLAAGNLIIFIGFLLGILPVVGDILYGIFAAIGSLVALGLAIFELVMLFKNPDGRRWGDTFADTVVVNLGDGSPTHGTAPPPPAPGNSQGTAPPPPPGAPHAAPPPPPGAPPIPGNAEERRDAPPPPPPGIPKS